MSPSKRARNCGPKFSHLLIVPKHCLSVSAHPPICERSLHMGKAHAFSFHFSQEQAPSAEVGPVMAADKVLNGDVTADKPQLKRERGKQAG